MGKTDTQFDAVVVGAGFAGMYMLHILRSAGYSVRVYEGASDVGGVWYWSRYPGARCDSPSIYYNYTFSEDLFKGWTWSSEFPEQPEILSYLNYVADQLDLRKDIQFNTKVTAAEYSERNNRWDIQLDDGSKVSAKYFITGVGGLSAANIPNIKGLEQFRGEWYHTGRWPHEKVNLEGKKVGVIGTGSSGIQCIPVIAKEAGQLTVFQRTAQYALPARNKPLEPEVVNQAKENFTEFAHRIRYETNGGVPYQLINRSALEDTPEERQALYEENWKKGGMSLFWESYFDLMINEAANETVGEFVRSKIRETVKNPETAENLLPNYLIGTKRMVLDTDYFETYNRENVKLVNLRKEPIVEFTQNGLKTEAGEYELDMVVFATGYDAMTGPLFKQEIRGKNGVSLKDKWEGGAKIRTQLGLLTADFPNMFMITGPQSPSVLGNVPTMIEQHVEWVFDCIQYLQRNGIETIEATENGQEQWNEHCSELASNSLLIKTDSWYTNANIEGKPRGINIYVGGLKRYRQHCDEAAANQYKDFSLNRY